MRASVDGWLLNSDPRPETKGWMMNMCAVAGFALSGTRWLIASILRSASARP